MQFQKFQEFLKTRDIYEWGINNPDLESGRRRLEFNRRFPDKEEGEKIVRASGWRDSNEFLNDKNERKWTKLKFRPDNWVK